MRCDCVKTQEAHNLDSAPFSPSSPREKWLRRRTHVKLRVINYSVLSFVQIYFLPQFAPVGEIADTTVILWLLN